MRLSRIFTFVAIWTALGVGPMGAPASAQERDARDVPLVFAVLEGDWRGGGTLLGRPAEFRMRWTIEPEGFVRLSFSNAWVGDDGRTTPVLAAEATYYPTGSSALGVWLDDRPRRLTLVAVLTDSLVTTEWTAEDERGRTEYRIRSPDSVVVRDVVYVDGSERLFGEATYQRARSRDAPGRPGRDRPSWDRKPPGG